MTQSYIFIIDEFDKNLACFAVQLCAVLWEGGASYSNTNLCNGTFNYLLQDLCNNSINSLKLEYFL